jgi:acetylglutamate kinase
MCAQTGWRSCWTTGLAPGVSTIGSDENGQPYNINADEAARAIAVAMAAEKIVYLTSRPAARRCLR